MINIQYFKTAQDIKDAYGDSVPSNVVCVAGNNDSVLINTSNNNPHSDKEEQDKPTIVNKINNQDITVDPAKETITLKHDNEHTGFGTITVNAVTSSIDSNITSNNIKEGVSILGVGGTLREEKPEEIFNIQPTTTDQAITPTEGSVFISGTVRAVTSNIDVNIQPENIKQGVSILGVEGTLREGSGGDTPDYRYMKGTIDREGLRAIGWTDEDILTYEQNTPPHYTWQNDLFKVSDKNKELYSLDDPDPSSYKENPSIEFIPKKNMESYFGKPLGFIDMKYVKGIPFFDTSNLTNMAWMFSNCNNLTSIPQLDTSNVTNMDRMFGNCNNLTSIPQLNTSNVTNMAWMFSNCNNLTAISQLNTSNVTSMSNMFNNCNNLITIPQLDTSNVTSMSNMFSGCSNLITIPQLNTSNVTDMNNMFSGCKSLESTPSLLDTSNVTDMSNMFNNCNNLTAIPQLDTSNVTDMNNMFNECYNLKSIPSLNTSNVTNMNRMFCECHSITSISSLNTSNVSDMTEMFYNCNSLTTIPQLDTSNVTSMINMFSECHSITSVPQLNTSIVTNMNYMFNNCRNLTTIPQLNTSNATEMTEMLGNCTSLTTVEGIDFSGLTSDLNNLFGWTSDMQNLTHFIVNGKINVSISDDFSIKALTAIDYDSVKSILAAADRTDNTNTKTLAFNRTMTDQNGELAALVTSCTSKGWVITGLTIN